MNPRNVIVIVVAVVLLLAGGLALYGGGGEPVPDAPVAANQAVPKPPKRVDAAKLIRKRPIPDDRPAAPEGAPNVVFVLASTQRRDQWTLYGGPEDTTPFVSARVKAAGVWFEDALAVAVDPHPTAAAVLTGRTPHDLGVVQLGPKLNTLRTPDSATTLAEVFAGHGWFTVGLSANHHVNTRAGLSQGFDWYRNSQPFSLKLGTRIDAPNLVRIALDRLGRRSQQEQDRPLFLQLAFVDSHKPFRVLPKEFEPFEGPDHDIAPYRATLRRLDDAMRTLVAGLESLGITEDNTLFVLVADHGEGLNLPLEHRFQHGFVLYESSVRIPFVMWGHTLPQGRAVPGLTSQIDVLPTVLGHLDLPIPDDVAGRDHSDILASGQSARDRAYADATFRGVHRASLWTSDRQCQKDYGSTQAMPDDAVDEGVV
ncbi:MAG: sulfatase, partial [Myxococcota bacterium]